MTGGWRVLVVDDQAEPLAELVEALREQFGAKVAEVVGLRSFNEAEVLLQTPGQDFDVLVLDIMEGEGQLDEDKSRGRRLFERVQDARWVPIVIYSGVAHEHEDLQNRPLIAVVAKGDTKVLYAAVSDALESGAGAINRRVQHSLDGLVRMLFRDHVAKHWSNYYSTLSDEAISEALMNVVAAWLGEWRIGGVDGPDTMTAVGHLAVESSYYLVPPVADHGLRAGSLLKHGGRWAIVLTPTCDLFYSPSGQGIKERKSKAERVLLAYCALAPELIGPNAPLSSKAKELISGNGTSTNRWYFLPAYLDVPDLIVDFEDLVALPLSDAADLERLADLNAPFGEHMLSRHSQWRGRVGKPDLDVDQILQRFIPAAGA